MTWLYYILFMTNLCWWVWWDSMQRNAVTMTHICLYYIWRVDLKNRNNWDGHHWPSHPSTSLFHHFLSFCLKQFSVRYKAHWGKGGWWTADRAGFTWAWHNVSPGPGVISVPSLLPFPSYRRVENSECQGLVWDDETHTILYNTHTVSPTHALTVPVCLAFLFPLLYSARANCFGPAADRGWPPLAFHHVVRQLSPPLLPLLSTLHSTPLSW